MSEEQEVGRSLIPGTTARAARGSGAGMGSTSDLDACPGKRILDGDELLPHLCKFVVKVLFGITPEPENLFFCFFADLEHLVLFVQHLILLVQHRML